MDKGLFPTPEEVRQMPRRVEVTFKKTWPEFYEFLKTIPGDSFAERTYNYAYNCPEHACLNCGKTTKFVDWSVGYQKYCCSYCSNHGPARIAKMKQTCMERFGVENPYASKVVQQKLKTIYNQKYGTDYPSQSPEVQAVRRANSLKKYGVEHHGQTEEVRIKLRKSNRQYFIENDENLLGYDGDLRIMKCPHPGCNQCKEKTYKITTTQYNARREYKIEPCTILHPIQVGKNKKSFTERSIRELLKNHHINILDHEDRSILPSNRGLDIVLPDYHIAIECNGDWWHSDKKKPYRYHSDKFKEAESVGYQLITIWDDQFVRTPNIVKSLILSKLGIYENRIYARQCQIRQIGGNVANNFYNSNHIQGQTRSQIHLGLFYKDQLVGSMSFSGRSKMSGGRNDSCWELTRFCVLINWQIVGAAGKLLNYFIKSHHPSKIISFASNDISDGKLYQALGFDKDSKITESYWYVHKQTNERYHRTSFCKRRLKAMGYDITKTETEIMSELPYHKIWDSGHTKYTLIPN